MQPDPTTALAILAERLAPDDDAGQEAVATLRRGVEALSDVLAHVDRSHPAWRTDAARAALSTADALVGGAATTGGARG